MAAAGQVPVTISEEKSDGTVLVSKEEEDGGSSCQRYNRSELEGLRFAAVEEQKRRWSGILGRLDPVVIQEYHQLVVSNQPRKPKWNNGRHQNLKQPKEVEFLIPAGGSVLDGAANGLYLLDSYQDSCVEGFKDGKNYTMAEEEEEEFCEEDEDSDDEHRSIQRLAFIIEGEPDFESGPPQDGLEYLRRVRWEAAQIPNVKVVRFDKSKCNEQTPYMPNIPDIPRCPEKLMPLKHWEDSFISDFSELRKAFSLLESPNSTASNDKALRSMKFDLLKDQLPTTRVILTMDPLSRVAMLKKLIDEFENATTLSRENCTWIFALCIAVDTPFDAEMSATMRCLLRKCSSLLAGKTEIDDEVVMFNILVMISGKYFGQSEK